MPLKKISLLFTLAVFLFAFKGDKKAYQIFNQNGKKASYDKILKEVETADIILFGELHDNPICHWMKLE